MPEVSPSEHYRDSDMATAKKVLAKKKDEVATWSAAAYERKRCKTATQLHARLAWFASPAVQTWLTEDLKKSEAEIEKGWRLLLEDAVRLDFDLSMVPPAQRKFVELGMHR